MNNVKDCVSFKDIAYDWKNSFDYQREVNFGLKKKIQEAVLFGYNVPLLLCNGQYKRKKAPLKTSWNYALFKCSFRV